MAHIYEAIVNRFSLQHGDSNLFLFSSNGKNTINDKLVALLEGSRNQFETGFPDQGIPPLEPISIDHSHLYLYQKGVIKANVDFYEIKIAGLNQFIIDDLNFKLRGLNLTFEFFIPQLIVTSTYEIDGKVASFIPFKPCGDARAEINNVKVKGNAVLGVSDGYLNLKSFTSEFDVEKIKIFMSGLLGGGIINNWINWVLTKIGTNVIQEQKQTLAATASDAISDIANEILQNIKLTDLIA